MATITNTVNITVYDLTTTLASYAKIAVFSSASGQGTYTEQTTSATRLTLVSSTDYYQYADIASGITNYTYKIKYANASGTLASSFVYDYTWANTSDITEDLRYEIDDCPSTISSRRYTTKELRRFVKRAMRSLQLTIYKRKYTSDINGIIRPRAYDTDQAIILLQSQIEVHKSQLTKAADTNMMFRDGRGTFNLRTHEALKANIKMLTEERDKLIKSVNWQNLTPIRVDMVKSGAST